MITHNKVKLLVSLSIFCISLVSGINFQDKNELKKLDQSMDNFEESMEKWETQMEKWGEDLENSIEQGQPIPPIPPIPGINALAEYDELSLKLGIYIENMDFEEAYHRHYPECYGVVVTGVVNGGNADRAGLISDDIIMEFDGEKVRYESHLLNLRDSKKIGDTVPVKYFRNEKVMETVLVFAPPVITEDNSKDWGDFDDFGKKKKLSVGYGGGGPLGILVDYDLDNLNSFIGLYDFQPIDKNSVVFFGGYGMGNVGKGLFIGGMGAGLKYDQKFNTADGNTRLLNIESGFGGVTVTKKLPLFSSDVILDFGTMIGGGRTTIELAQSDGNYSWDTPSIEEGNNWYAKYEKDYLTLYPSVGVLVRIKSWFGLHASTGYLWNYSIKESWSALPLEFDVGGDNAPDPFNGQTVEIGVWFGN